MGPVEKSRLQYMAEKLNHVEHERSLPVTQDDVARILRDLSSDDDDTLAGALREVCPCRMSWEVFEQVRKPALKHRKHASALIRGLANHIEEDAQEVAALEALRERELEHEGLDRPRRGRQRNRRG